nr:PREDICTED: mismatch repair endonuclease pms1 isoform X2 [Bemisia tabaci]
MLHSNLLFTTASKSNRKFCDVSSPLNRDRSRGFQSSNQSARTSPTTTNNTVSFINTEVSSQVDSHFQQNASQYDSSVRCSMNSSSKVDERFSASAGDTEDYLEAPLDLSVKKSSPCVTSLENTLLDCNPDEDFDRHQKVDYAEPSYFQIRKNISPSRVNVQPLSTDCLKRRMEELKNSKGTHEEYIDAPRNHADPLENTEARNNHSREKQGDDTPNYSIESTHTQSISPLRILETPNQKFPPDQDFSQPSSSFRDCEFAPLRARVTPKCSGLDELNRSHCDESIFSDDVTPKCSGLDELNRSHCDESIFSDDFTPLRATPKCSGLDELNRSHCDESIFSDDVTPKCSGIDELNRSHCDESIFSDDVTPKCSGLDELNRSHCDESIFSDDFTPLRVTPKCSEHDELDRSHRNESIFSDSQHSPEKEGEDKMMEETLFESACHPSDDPLSEDINDCCRGLENMFISISGSAENMAASSNATYGFPDAQNLQTDGTVNLTSTDEIESMVSQFAEEDRTQIQQAGKIITDQKSYNTNAQINSDRRTPKSIQATSIVVHATSGMSFILPSIQNALLLPETSIDSRGNPRDELVLEDNHFQFVEKQKRNFPEDADQDAFWGMLSRFDTLTSKFCTLKSKGLGNLEKGHVENESSNISLSVLSRSVLEDTLAKSMGTSRELFVFEKKLFNALEVVGQLDSKFILTILEVSKSRLIVAFDQHAVDERIRVEKLMNDYCVDFKAKVWKSVCVNPVIIMTVSTERAILCENFKSAFQKVGLVFSVNGRKLTITRIPLCLFNSAQRNNDALLDLTCSLLNEMIQSIVDLNGVYPSIPNCILSAINEEACKRAVKFGDKLTHFQCKALLEGLKTCRFPFQCAHGRPLLFPIANLNLLSD